MRTVDRLLGSLDCTWADVVKGVVKFIVGSVLAVILSQLIGSQFANRRAEVELEAGLVRDLSEAAVMAYLTAQDANRVSGTTERESAGKAVQDAWVSATDGKIVPVLETYYGRDRRLSNHWDDYDKAVYAWISLGCCTDVPRADRVDLVRSYVENHTDRRAAPPPDTWERLRSTSEAADYQEAGLALLRGRGALLRELEGSRPRLA